MARITQQNAKVLRNPDTLAADLTSHITQGRLSPATTSHRTQTMLPHSPAAEPSQVWGAIPALSTLLPGCQRAHPPGHPGEATWPPFHPSQTTNPHLGDGVHAPAVHPENSAGSLSCTPEEG